jgi:hypothetical protein
MEDVMGIISDHKNEIRIEPIGNIGVQVIENTIMDGEHTVLIHTEDIPAAIEELRRSYEALTNKKR